jgi:UV DNA damage endonuclease
MGEPLLSQEHPIRLGFPVNVLGVAGLRSHDSRRWQNQPHLSVSLAYLRDVFAYLHSRQITFYRMAGQLAPYLTHPGLPQFHHQLEECSNELAAIGDLARQQSLRLSMHPGHFIQLGSPDPIRVQRSKAELNAAAALLAHMGAGPETVLVIHVGGVFGDRERSLERVVHHLEELPTGTRQHLVLENDDRHYSLQDILWIYRRTGLRLVLDTLHHRCLDPEGVPLVEALRLALATWPADQQPKVHVSSPCTSMRRTLRDGTAYLRSPLPNQHSDCIHPFQFIDLIREAQAAKLRSFDIMLEAKAKDLALLRLRAQIGQYAPGLTGVVV